MKKGLTKLEQSKAVPRLVKRTVFNCLRKNVAQQQMNSLKREVAESWRNSRLLALALNGLGRYEDEGEVWEPRELLFQDYGEPEVKG